MLFVAIPLLHPTWWQAPIDENTIHTLVVSYGGGNTRTTLVRCGEELRVPDNHEPLFMVKVTDETVEMVEGWARVVGNMYEEKWMEHISLSRSLGFAV